MPEPTKKLKLKITHWIKPTNKNEMISSPCVSCHIADSLIHGEVPSFHVARAVQIASCEDERVYYLLHAATSKTTQITLIDVQVKKRFCKIDGPSFKFMIQMPFTPQIDDIEEGVEIDLKEIHSYQRFFSLEAIKSGEVHLVVDDLDIAKRHEPSVN